MKTLSLTLVALVVSLFAVAPAAAETFNVEMRNATGCGRCSIAA